MTTQRTTKFPELNEALDDLVSSVQDVLGENFVGLYMQGSIAVGDFDEHSDADFVVVTEQELSDEQVADLQEMHARIFDCGKEWAKHLEGAYFPRAVLEDPSSAGEKLWYLDHGDRQLALQSLQHGCGPADRPGAWRHACRAGPQAIDRPDTYRRASP